jgi:voltage-gated potassium channel
MMLLPQRELVLFARRVVVLGVIVAGLVLFGTIGLSVTDHVDLWFSFRWTLDTLSTVGRMGEPHSTGGQVVEVLLIVLGVGTLFYAFASVTEFFVAGHLGELLAARRLLKMTASLTDHHIICGYGRVGRQVSRDLRAAGAKYVVIDSRPENRELAQGVGVRFIEGDAADDAVLRAAGIDHARSILVCADSDAENIFITLTARELRADIAIVARAAVEDSEKKLKRAGADRVISPYKASGAEMARLALHPQVSGVLEVDAEYRMEEIVVADGCRGANQTIGDIRGGAMIVGMRRDGAFQPQPPGETLLLPGDILMAMGTPRTLERLERLFDVQPGPVPAARAGDAAESAP